jgi:OTU-like cysteine protease
MTTRKTQHSSGRLPSILACLLLSSVCVTFIQADTAASPPRNSIPKSTHNSQYDRLRKAAVSLGDDGEGSAALLQERPPWNPSPQIDDAGFCRDVYTRIPGEWEADVRLGGKHQNTFHLEMVQVNIRQVPGDGNCLFHSISTCMAQVVNGTQLEYPTHLGWLYRHSASLRQQAVDCLRQKRKTLYLQGREYLRANDLVEAAAAQYGITASQYCDLMQQDSYWGGGPEIVALSNVLKRPIHVYELASCSKTGSSGSCFVLRRMACFGSPKFDKKEPFHILSADSRFPDIAPGKQMASGNHFLAVFPVAEQQAALEEWIREERKNKRNKVRGGGGIDEMARKRMALKGNVDRRIKKESLHRTIQAHLLGLWNWFFLQL